MNSSPAVSASASATQAPWRKLFHVCSSLLRQTEEACRAGVCADDYSEPDALASAQNFMAYLGIRRTDIRAVQRDLHRVGISSLGRIETHVVDSLASVSTILAQLSGESAPSLHVPRLGFDAGEEILARRTGLLLGPKPARCTPRIMVTMPNESAPHYDLVRDMVAAGMQVARVNCAHDGPEVWSAIIQHVRRSSEELGRPCRILCDLPGPKLRTGPMEAGPGVVRWRAFRDAYGKVVDPARVWISAGCTAPGFAHATLPVNGEFVAQLLPGDEVHFRDHQGRSRWLIVTAVEEGGAWADAARGAFMVPGIRLVARRDDRNLPVIGEVAELPPMPGEIAVKCGDELILVRTSDEAGPARPAQAGSTTSAAQISCALPELFRDARPGQRIFFDDGKVAGRVEEVGPDHLRVKVTWTRALNAKLSEDKGINVPDSRLVLPALTSADLSVLDFVAAHASQIDAVGLSFVRHADDVNALIGELDRRGIGELGVILKIETATAFQNLPGIILSALRRNKVGVMIARGDLGVEVGFERMAELQEEIGSLCAAAHLPVIWATQVLETLAKKGMPSRAEVSDVVLAARTQCVMLNKGPHVVAAIRFLADVLERMEGHQDKHFRLMRALRVAAVHPSSGHHSPAPGPASECPI